jgi:hypothetical protein
LVGELGVSPTGLPDLPMPFQFEPVSVHTDDFQYEMNSAPPQQFDAAGGGQPAGTQSDTSDTDEG